VTTAFIDTSILIHLYRKHPNAVAWLKSQTQLLSITSIVWLEFMDGVPSKTGQKFCLSILDNFELIRLIEADQDWAMSQLKLYRLSKGVHDEDCLVASVCHRLQVPIYTHNVKDMQKLLPNTLVKRPFTA
jgi:predicted nucleic acid-binding protein